jgi:hypothetical protein
VNVPVKATDIGLVTGGLTKFRYYVETYDREGNVVDGSGWITYDLANPGLNAQGGNAEFVYYLDMPNSTIPVNYNFVNMAANGTKGLLLAHMHNGNGSQADVVKFLQLFKLTVTLAGTGTGTVASAPAGIACPGTCAFDFSDGQVVTLTAAPTGASAFTGWSGDAPAGCGMNLTCEVTMSAAKNVTATFTPTYVLTVTKAGNGSGTVTSLAPNLGIDCGATCAATYVSGTVVTLHAVADAGKTFTGWTAPAPGCPGTGDCVVTITATTGVTATFVDTTPPDTTITDGPGNPTPAFQALFAFTSTEGGSTFECSLDGAAFAPCTSPASVNVGPGNHSFQVRAVDPAGNVDPTPASYAWQVLPPALANQIPTVHEWMLIVMALLLGAMGLVALRRRQA